MPGAQPRVSVVIPAYRNADFVAETIESVLAQTFDDYELVMADHSSDDGTQTILERYASDPHVRLLDPTPAGGGAQRNWNRVSEAASGEYLKLLPADDLLAPRALAVQVAALDAHPDAVLAASNRAMITDTGAVLIANRGLPASLVGAHDAATAVRTTVRAGTNVFGEPGAVLLRRSALERAGWWDGRSGYAIDVQSYVNTLAYGGMVGIDEVLSSFRISAQQWSVRLASSQASEMAEVFRGFRAAHPTWVSATDVRLGSAKAWASAMGRRAVYIALDLIRRVRDGRASRAA